MCEMCEGPAAPLALAAAAKASGAGPRTTRLKVEGMDCASCAQKVDRALRRIDGVEDVNVTVTTGAVSIVHASRISEATLTEAIEVLGYDVLPAQLARPATSDGGGHDHSGRAHDHSGHLHTHGAADGRSWWRTRKAQLTVACALALGLAYAIGWLVPSVGPYAFIAAIAVGLVPIARRAVSAAMNGSPFTIESLMTVAAAGAVVIGEAEEAAVVVLLFLVGELLEGVAAGRARASISALAALVPKTALAEREGGTTEEVAAESLAVGAIILVRPGDRIPADGTVLSGEGGVDEAPVTGESVPKAKREGDAVFAGTVNLDAALRISVTAAAADNTIARVVRLVEEAQESKAPTERFIDRFSRYYTPAVFLIGLLIAVVPPLFLGASWHEWIYKGLAILLIGCPCALVISTPAAIAAGLSAGARHGLLMKGGAVLEGMGRITIAAFDKTGTLTSGKPQVTDVVGLSRSEDEVLALAAALETGSSHPLAQAILKRAAERMLALPPATDLRALPGNGVSGAAGGLRLYFISPRSAGEMATLPAEVMDRIAAMNGEGKSVSVLVADGAAAGLIALRDEPRPDAKAGIEALKRLGIASLMVTGDNTRTAESIGAALSIEPRAELMPQDKQAIVRELQARGERVAKIGDGINDAPGLAAADIGIAMGGGTDVALEAADAAVLHGRVMDVARMVALSRSVMRNIGQNVTIALGLKAVFLVTTILGVTGLWPAILADTGATVLVTVNALRLLSGKLTV